MPMLFVPLNVSTSTLELATIVLTIKGFVDGSHDISVLACSWQWLLLWIVKLQVIDNVQESALVIVFFWISTASCSTLDRSRYNCWLTLDRLKIKNFDSLKGSLSRLSSGNSSPTWKNIVGPITMNSNRGEKVWAMHLKSKIPPQSVVVKKSLIWGSPWSHVRSLCGSEFQDRIVQGTWSSLWSQNYKRLL